MTRPELVLLHAPSNYDFRTRSIIYGPISDVIPSSPIFEMYPIGFISIAGYLEKHGVPTRVVNIANRMLSEPGFDVERFLSKLNPLAFGIDLHWLPHAQGSLELGFGEPTGQVVGIEEQPALEIEHRESQIQPIEGRV